MTRRMAPDNVDSVVIAMEGRVKVKDEIALAVLNAASVSRDAHAESVCIDDEEVSYASDSLQVNT